MLIYIYPSGLVFICIINVRTNIYTPYFSLPMLTFNKMWFLEILFRVIVILMWLGSTSLLSLYTYTLIVYINACLSGQRL